MATVNGSAGSRRTVAVFGSSRRAEDDGFFAEAYELGQVLAREGYAVLSGGYGGSMAAVSRGAAETGGRVIGVTCAIFDPLPPNPWLTEEIKASDLMERLRIMVERSDAFIAARGGIGTLSELTLVWSMLPLPVRQGGKTRSLRGKPLVLLGESWAPVVDALLRHTDLSGTIAALASIASTPAQAVELLAALTVSPTPPSPPPLG